MIKLNLQLLSSLPNNLQELYYPMPAMKTECEQELDIYLSSILKALVAEKKNQLNFIDLIVKNKKGTSSQSKWCAKCNATNIDNKKRTCPQCGTKLATLATLRATSANESIVINNTTSEPKSLKIKFHTFTHKPNAFYLEHISITQWTKLNQNIIVLEMYIHDSLSINSNSVSNIRKILKHIEVIIGIA